MAQWRTVIYSDENQLSLDFTDIFSDSLSVLKAINHTSSKNQQIQKLIENCHELLANNSLFSVEFLVI